MPAVRVHESATADDALARDRADFAGDLLHLWAIGADIDRTDGPAAPADGLLLPVTFVDGLVVASGRYPTRAQLLRFLRIDAAGKPRRRLDLQETDAASSAAAREPDISTARPTVASAVVLAVASDATRASTAAAASGSSAVRKTGAKRITNGSAEITSSSSNAQSPSAPRAEPRAESPTAFASSPSVARREPQLISLVATGTHASGSCACGTGGTGGCCST